jgi:hypothetical protein
LSPYQRNLLELLKEVNYRRTATEKLLLTFYDKENYIIHYKNLKLYLELGLQIKKVHKILSFKQSKWIKPYIELNTELRKNSTNDFETDLFKLMSNSIYGKSVEDKRNHMNIKCALTEKQVKRWIKQPSFESFDIIDEHKAFIKMRKNSVTLDRPIYVGFCVLELSKRLMYDFYYNVFKEKYNDNLNLLYCDTDSFIMKINTNDIYVDLKSNELNKYFDFSNYPNEHFLYDTSRKKQLGFLKDETSSQPIVEFIGLKSKLYSIQTEHENKKVAKGLQKAVLKKYITHDNYKNCLNNVIYYAMNVRFQSKKHEIKTIRCNKLIYTPFCDKRYIKNDGISSYAFGHKNIV